MWRKLKNLIADILGLEKEILCDTCRYNFGSACKRPERPNATKCSDYRRMGR